MRPATADLRSRTFRHVTSPMQASKKRSTSRPRADSLQSGSSPKSTHSTGKRTRVVNVYAYASSTALMSKPASASKPVSKPVPKHAPKPNAKENLEGGVVHGCGRFACFYSPTLPIEAYMTDLLGDGPQTILAKSQCKKTFVHTQTESTSTSTSTSTSSSRVLGVMLLDTSGAQAEALSEKETMKKIEDSKAIAKSKSKGKAKAKVKANATEKEKEKEKAKAETDAENEATEQEKSRKRFCMVKSDDKGLGLRLGLQLRPSAASVSDASMSDAGILCASDTSFSSSFVDDADVETSVDADACSPLVLGCKLGVYEDLLAEFEVGQRLQRLDPSFSRGVYVLGVARLRPGFETDAAVIESAGGAHFPRDIKATGVAFEIDGGEAVVETLLPAESRMGALRADSMPPLTDAELFHGLLKMWNALDALHAAGEVHGDIHIRNIVRDRDAGFRFIDFKGLPPPSDPSKFQRNAFQQRLHKGLLTDSELVAEAKASDEHQKNVLMAEDILKMQSVTKHLVRLLQESRGSVELLGISRDFVLAQPNTHEYANNAQAWLQEARIFTHASSSASFCTRMF